MNKKILLLLLISMLLISVIAVKAQEGANPLEALAEGLGGLNLAETYNKYPQFFDGVIFAIIFITLALMTLGKRFKEGAGKTLSVVVGLALAIALETWAYTEGITIREFGPIAALILLALVGWLMYYTAESLGMSKTNSGLIGFVVAFTVMRSINLHDWAVSRGGILLMVYGFANAALWIAIIMLVIRGFTAMFGDTGAKSVARKLIEAGGVKGAGKKAFSTAGELLRGKKSAEAYFDKAQKKIEKGDQAGARDDLRNAAEQLIKDIETSKELEALLEAQVKAYESLPKTGETIAKLKELIDKIKESKKRREQSAAVADTMMRTADSSNEVTSEVARRLTEMAEASSPAEASGEAAELQQEVERAMAETTSELIKERSKVEGYLMSEIKMIQGNLKKNVVGSIRSSFRHWLRRKERYEYRWMTRLLELIRSMGGDTSQLEVLNNVLVKFLSVDGEIDKEINKDSPDIDKIHEYLKTSLEAAEGLLIWLRGERALKGARGG